MFQQNCTLNATYLLVFFIFKIALEPPISQKIQGALPPSPRKGRHGATPAAGSFNFSLGRNNSPES